MPGFISRSGSGLRDPRYFRPDQPDRLGDHLRRPDQPQHLLGGCGLDEIGRYSLPPFGSYLAAADHIDRDIVAIESRTLSSVGRGHGAPARGEDQPLEHASVNS